MWIEIGKSVDTAQNYIVTPYAGVWIEILYWSRVLVTITVTPYAGVWIEMHMQISQVIYNLSLPTRECGLKYLPCRF